eukprot:scaffold5980_cov376-Prasinococcus_capsulatus_cf.AAC.10
MPPRPLAVVPVRPVLRGRACPIGEFNGMHTCLAVAACAPAPVALQAGTSGARARPQRSKRSVSHSNERIAWAGAPPLCCWSSWQIAGITRALHRCAPRVVADVERVSRVEPPTPLGKRTTGATSPLRGVR